MTLASLAPFLRFDGERGDRAGFEALDPDFLAGLEAIAVGAILGALQRLVDLSNELTLAIRVRSSRLNSSSCVARSLGSGKFAASSFM